MNYIQRAIPKENKLMYLKIKRGKEDNSRSQDPFRHFQRKRLVGLGSSLASLL
jgi:hypothetical protein